MRILLDENIEEGLVVVLRGLGHEEVHVSATEHRSKTDQELVEVARHFDVFVTLDLHRQEPEWLAVNRALVEGGIKIIRIRLPKQSTDPLLDVVRSLIYRMEWWMAEIRKGSCLVTIGQMGTVSRSMSREDAMKILEQRQ